MNVPLFWYVFSGFKNAKIQNLLILLFFFAIQICGEFTFAASRLTLQGRLIEPDGVTPVEANVQFRIQIRSPGVENCLLYEETSSFNTTTTSGNFALTIGSGTRSAPGIDGGHPMEKIFANKAKIDLSSTSPLACSNGDLEYSPTADAGRKLVYSFNDGTGWQTVPEMAINWVPMAFESRTVGGFAPENIFRVQDALGNPSVIAALTPAQATELMALALGSSTTYVKPGSATFTAAPQYSGAVSGANDLTNKSYVDSAISTAVGSVSGGSITSGTIGGTTAVNTSGNIVTTGTVSAQTLSGSVLRIYNGSDYVQFTAPALSGSNVLFVLPSADGTSGQVLRTDGSGNLSWVSPSTGSVTSVSASAPLASSGGATPTISITQADTSTNGYLSSTDWNTFNNKLGTATSFSGDVSGAYNATSVDKIKGVGVDYSVAPSSGNYFKYDGTNWVPSNLAAGDIPNLDASKITAGTLPVARGGTGATSITDGQLVVGGTLGATYESRACTMGQTVAFGALGQVLCENTGGASQLVRLDASSNLAAPNHLTVAGNATVTGNTSVTGNLAVTGTSTLTGDVAVNGHLNMASDKHMGLGQFAADPATGTWGNAEKGRTWFNTTSNEIKYWDGAAIRVLGVSGSGLTSLNGSNQGTQSFATPGTSGTAPAWSTNAGTGVHTLNIPLASDASVTAGLLSKTKYDEFDAKLGTGTSFSGDVSGNYNSTSVDKIKGTTVSINAITSGNLLKYDGTNWINSNLVAGDIPDLNASKITSGTLDAGRMPAFTGDVTTSAGSTASTVAKLQTYPIDLSVAPTNGKVLKYDGTNWIAGDDNATDATKLPLAGGTMSGAIAMGGFDITNAGNIELAASKHLGLSQHAADPATGTWGNTEKGRTWFNTTSNEIKYWDGGAVRVLGVAGSGLTSLNGSNQGSQSFATPGTSGTAPAWSTNAGTGVHTLNIPQASDTGVTAGLLSKTKYDEFDAKLGTGTSFSGDISGNYNSTSVDKIKGTTVSITSLTSGNILRYDGTNWVNTALVAGDVPDIDAAKITTGVLPIARGGTNNGSLGVTNGGIIYADGSKLMTSAAGTSGQPLLSGGAGAPTWGTLGAGVGGTGLTTYTAGDLTYATAATTLSKLAIGGTGSVLTSTGSAPQWSASLPIGSGGTGATALSSNGVVLSNGTGTALSSLTCVTTGHVLKWNGTNWACAADDSGSGTGVTGSTGAQGGDATVLGGTSTTSSNPGGQALVTGGTPGVTGIGGVVAIKGGPGGSTSGAGGEVSILGGVPTSGAGGAINITAANGVGTSQAGGSVSITAGSGSATSGAGGAITIMSGASTSLGAAGNITIKGGSNTNNGGSSTVLIQGSDGGNGVAGPVQIRGGAAKAVGTSTGGLVTVQGGAASASLGSSGGGVSVLGSSGAAGGTGGGISITSGAGGAAGSGPGPAAGSISISASAGGPGAAGWAGAAGAAVTISAGAGGAGGGAASGGVGGNLILSAGSAGTNGNVNGGDVTLNGGAKTGAGRDGHVLLANSRGAVGIGTSSIEASAILEITSVTKGVLIPRMTTTERDAIGTPAAGLQVYNTTTNALNYYNGSSWQALGVAGSGITSFNGSSQSSQSFATPGTSGTAPAWSTNAGTGVHTLNIPLASDASVTAGLLSKTKYDEFDAKLGTGTSFSGDVSGAYNSTSVDKIKGTTVSITSLTSGNILRYNGTNWVNTALVAGDVPDIDAAKITTGVLPIARGGTNNGSLGVTNGGIIYADGSKLMTSAAGTSGQPLLSGGAGAPTWGTLGIGAGGTGATALSSNGVVLSNGTGTALSSLTCVTTGHVLKWNGTNWACAADDSGGFTEDASFSLKAGTNALANNLSTSLYNLALGYESQQNMRAGAGNTGNISFGYRSMRGSATIANNTGINNYAAGHHALSSISTGNNNTAIGPWTLLYSTTSSDNIAVGWQSQMNNTLGTNNIALGSATLMNNTESEYNVAIGQQSQERMNPGSGEAGNIAIGRQAIRGSATVANNTGKFNVGIGDWALQSVTSGSTNVAIGNNPLQYTTTGIQNVAIGNNPLQQNTTGGLNVALGNGALQSNTTGSYNVSLGASALTNNQTGSNSVSIGPWTQELMRSSTGGNIAIGDSALRGSATVANNTGGYNLALGLGSLYSVTSGSYNTALGYGSLRTNSTGENNVGIGHDTLYSNTVSGHNIAIGNRAQNRMRPTVDGYNIAFGRDALSGSSTVANNTGTYNFAAGLSSLNSNSSGSNNIAIGQYSLFNNTVANNNVALGYYAMSRMVGTGSTSNIAIGGAALQGSATLANNTGTLNAAIGEGALGGLTSGNGNIALGAWALLSGIL